MKRYRSLFVFCLSAFVPLAWAQVGPGGPTTSTSIQLHFVRDVQLSATETFASVPMTYADGTTALPGEQLAFVFAVAKVGSSLPTDGTVPFALSADGALVATDDRVEMLVWGAVSTSASTVHSVTIGEDGLPAEGWQPMGGGNGETTVIPIYWPDAAGARPARYAYLYSVLLDTRAVDPVTGGVSVAGEPFVGDKAPAPLAAYGATWCHRFNAMAMGVATLWMNIPEGVSAPGTTGTVVAATSATELPTTLVVDGETLTDPGAIEAALVPAIAGLADAQDAEGNPALSLTLSPAKAPGLTTYTLWTADDLEGEWITFDALLREKGLATEGEVRYTKWRISKGSQVSIPRLPGENTRFYRLKGDSAQGE